MENLISYTGDICKVENMFSIFNLSHFFTANRNKIMKRRLLDVLILFKFYFSLKSFRDRIEI